MYTPQQLWPLEKKYGLPSGLLSAVMMQESSGDPNAVGPVTKNGERAQGLFQFMPATAKAYNIDPMDPEQAADGAARMYADLSKQYNGDVPQMLAGYNWGSGNLAKNGMDAAPPETVDYVSKITKNMPQYAEAQNAAPEQYAAAAPTTMTDATIQNMPPEAAGATPPNSIATTGPAVDNQGSPLPKPKEAPKGEPKLFNVTMPDGTVVSNVPEGTPSADIEAAWKSMKPSEAVQPTPAPAASPTPEAASTGPSTMGQVASALKDAVMNSPIGQAQQMGVDLAKNPKELGRQLGLTGRHVAEGVAGMGDLVNLGVNAVGEPFGMKPLQYPSQMVGDALTKLGVPQPKDGLERVVGDISRGVVGAGAGSGAANLLKQGAAGATKLGPMLETMAANPEIQAKVAATSAGAAGGTREAGGGPLAQMAAGVAGGVGATKLAIPKKEIYTAADVKKFSNDAYAKADALGGQLNPQFTDKFIQAAQSVNPQTPAGKILGVKTAVTDFTERLKGLAGKPLSLKEAQEIDEMIGDEIENHIKPNGSPNKQGMKLLDIQHQFRDMIENPSAGDMMNKAGFEAWRDGSKLWSKAMKLGDVERIVARADMSDNPATAMRSGFRTIAANPKRMRGYSKEEQVAIKRAAKGGPVDEVLRWAGNRLSPAVGLGTGNVLGAMAAIPMGMAAREGGALLQLRRANKVAEKIYGSKPRNVSGPVMGGALGTLYGNNVENK